MTLPVVQNPFSFSLYVSRPLVVDNVFDVDELCSEQSSSGEENEIKELIGI